MSTLKVDQIRSADRSISDSANITLADDGTLSTGNIKLANDGTIGSTGDADAIKISSAGIVSQTAKPAFLARASSVTSNITINTAYNVFNSTTTTNYHDFDQGNHYDETNKRFTAPVNGIYFFHASWDMRNTIRSDASYYIPEFGVDTGSGYNTFFQAVYDITTNESHHTFQLTSLMNLASGNYVIATMYQGGGTQDTDIDNGAGTYFLGYLVG